MSTDMEMFGLIRKKIIGDVTKRAAGMCSLYRFLLKHKRLKFWNGEGPKVYCVPFVNKRPRRIVKMISFR